MTEQLAAPWPGA